MPGSSCGRRWRWRSPRCPPALGGGPGGGPSPGSCNPWGAGVSPGSAHPMSCPGEAVPAAASIHREAAGVRAGERLGAPPRLSPPPGVPALGVPGAGGGATHRSAPPVGLSPAASASSASASSSASAPGRWVRGGAAPSTPCPKFCHLPAAAAATARWTPGSAAAAAAAAGAARTGGGSQGPPWLRRCCRSPGGGHRPVAQSPEFHEPREGLSTDASGWERSPQHGDGTTSTHSMSWG